ncbi:ORF0 [turkey adenovirus 5]|uniref:ORF0 n=1 Tax=turkey adenovirus 5 TaxID=1408258 RepID=U5NHS1_9ADEN|nr:ORF0 [Turkey aviadenovirus 5]AGX93324.1 ORF0 [Turkey aviadenovirus 5]AGX93361.1 ORF0 [Turkey aviadenovirus 5]
MDTEKTRPRPSLAAVEIVSPLLERPVIVSPPPVRIDIYKQPGFPPSDTIWYGCISQAELNDALQAIVELL